MVARPRRDYLVMSITRRGFLKTVIVTAGTLSVATPLALRTSSTRAVPADYFPHSVASGDPKPNSVVLWTRLQDERFEGGRESLPLRLQVSASESFDAPIVDVEIEALGANDGCVRVKVTGLAPRTHYFYRFVAFTPVGNESVIGRQGRTRTAPDPDDPVRVRFALASCQDYIGKYYNAYLPLLEPEYDDLDFLLHVGDFIYETTGDPSFQGDGGERNLIFDDEDGAIKFFDESGAVAYMAARSLSNYRQLYQTYRSDEVLQEVLERFPLVPLWDDHEFTDDSWRDHSTYFGGLGTLPHGDSIEQGNGSENIEEQDLERRRNAEQAFLEYLPIDDEDLMLSLAPAGSALEVRDILDKGEDRLYPYFRFFRELRFGRLCNLVLTDYRSYRSNHPVDEDAFPGTLLYGEDIIRTKYDEIFGEQGAERFEGNRRLFKESTPPLVAVLVDLNTGNPSGLREYVAWADLSDKQRDPLRTQLATYYEASGFAPEAALDKSWAVLEGDLDVEYLNSIIDAYNQGPGTKVPTIPLNIQKPAGEVLNPYGLTNYCLYKIGLLGAMGARYALNPEWYELWRALRADETGDRPPEEDAYGEDAQGTGQETWLQGVIAGSDATWNILASSVSSSSIIIDLENEELLPPDGSLPDSGPGGVNRQLEMLRKLLVLLMKLLGLGTRFYVSCDQWDGLPNKRYELHSLYREKGNLILVSGDIHSSWINDFSTAAEGNLFEFTGTSISSATFSGVLYGLLDARAASPACQARPAAPFAGFLRALRQALSSSPSTLDPNRLRGTLDPDTDAELKFLFENAFGASLDTGIPKAEGLSGLIEQLVAVLDLYFFDFTHESLYLKTEEDRSKVKSELVGIDSGSNGLVVIDVDQDSVLATYLLVAPSDVERSYYDPIDRGTFLAEKVQTRRFRVNDGSLEEV
jgi:alkaline phosphatase D